MTPLNGAPSLSETNPQQSIVEVIPVSATPTDGDDALLGTPDPDLINGLAGDDIILGLDSDDTLNGGAGDDTLIGNLGDDEVFGEFIILFKGTTTVAEP